MSSYRRNTAAKTLLLGVSAALLASAGHAASDTHFTMTAFSNVAGGQEILSGDYKAALTKLSAKSNAGDDASVLLNRCVALTMTAQWPEAQAACNQAVHFAELVKASQMSGGLQERHFGDEGLAIAYTDRAVLKWLTADKKAAEEDLQRAKALLPTLDTVARNVTAFGARSTVAEVRSAEQR